MDPEEFKAKWGFPARVMSEILAMPPSTLGKRLLSQDRENYTEASGTEKQLLDHVDQQLEAINAWYLEYNTDPPDFVFSPQVVRLYKHPFIRIKLLQPKAGERLDAVLFENRIELISDKLGDYAIKVVTDSLFKKDFWVDSEAAGTRVSLRVEGDSWTMLRQTAKTLYKAGQRGFSSVTSASHKLRRSRKQVMSLLNSAKF